MMIFYDFFFSSYLLLFHFSYIFFLKEDNKKFVNYRIKKTRGVKNYITFLSINLKYRKL